jgi:hypothetical protein
VIDMLHFHLEANLQKETGHVIIHDSNNFLPPTCNGRVVLKAVADANYSKQSLDVTGLT